MVCIDATKVADASALAVSGAQAEKLIAAALSGDLSLINALLAAKADPNAKEPDGETALIASATAKGHVDVVNALLAAGANPNAKGPDGGTALILAAANGDVDVVKALQAAKAGPNLARIRA